jgi:alpha-methylacyl-CoA racemase
MPALDGIRVLDLAKVGPGPFCTMMLGDHGAEVIKVEAPPSIEDRRQAGTFRSPGNEARREAIFNPIDRNKKSIGINFRSAAGLEVFHRLAARADVVVEAFRPGVAKRLKIDYATLSRINPRLVYCAITGYGQDGPYRNLAGHEANYISMAGALGLIGEAEGPPAIPLTLVADRGGSAQQATIAILAAIVARQTTGCGQYIDISIMDSVIQLLVWPSYSYFYHGVVPERGTTTDQGAFPYYGVYETKDGKYISIGCIEPWYWEKLLKVVDKPEYIEYCFQNEHLFLPQDDPKWKQIKAELGRIFLTRPRDAWFDLLRAEDIPVGKVQSLDEVFNDPQVRHRGMVVEVEDPEFGTVRQLGIAAKLGGTPGSVRTLSPTFGEHTADVLACLGYTEAETAEFYSKNAIG